MYTFAEAVNTTAVTMTGCKGNGNSVSGPSRLGFCILAPGFRGLIPWSAASIALGLGWGRTSWQAEHQRKRLLSGWPGHRDEGSCVCILPWLTPTDSLPTARLYLVIAHSTVDSSVPIAVRPLKSPLCTRHYWTDVFKNRWGTIKH